MSEPHGYRYSDWPLPSGRYFYITGCKSLDKASEMLEDSFADGSISAGDQP